MRQDLADGGDTAPRVVQSLRAEEVMTAPTKRKQRNRKTRPANLVALERRRRAIELRGQGKTFVEIGKELGVTGPRAFQLVTQAIDDVNALLVSEVKAHRQKHLDELHAMRKGIWKDATAGQVGKIDRIIKLLEREARLLGLDAAEKFEHAGPDGGPITVDAMRSGVAAELTRLAAKRREQGPGG
jgi:hypothetical protein